MVKFQFFGYKNHLNRISKHRYVTNSFQQIVCFSHRNGYERTSTTNHIYTQPLHDSWRDDTGSHSMAITKLEILLNRHIRPWTFIHIVHILDRRQREVVIKQRQEKRG